MGTKPKSIHLKMTQGEHARAMELLSASDCRSMTELLRHALQLYDVAYQARLGGAEIMFVDPESGSMGPVLVASLAGVGRSDDQ